MLQLIKRILPWIVPQPFLVRFKRLFRSRAEASASAKFRAMLAANRSLRNRHADRKRCFVIGNGPSLKTQDLSKLKDEICIVANGFFFHPDHRVVAPRYWCVGDPDYLSGKGNSEQWLRQLDQTSTGAVMVLNPVGEPAVREHNLFAGREVFYVSAGLDCDVPEDVRLDLTEYVNVGMDTVTLLSIPLAIYLGFKEIYLIGCDANWQAVDAKAPLHFYATNPLFPHWDNMTGQDKQASRSVEDSMMLTVSTFKSHRLIRDTVSRQGIRIWNATNGGRLDMHPRVAYESLF